MRKTLTKDYFWTIIVSVISLSNISLETHFDKNTFAFICRLFAVIYSCTLTDQRQLLIIGQVMIVIFVAVAWFRVFAQLTENLISKK